MTLPSRGHALRASATIAAIVLLLLSTAAFGRHQPPRPAAPQPDSFDDLYLRGQRANAAIKTLTAHFTETTTSSLLTRPLVSHGRLAVERPSRVVLRYTEPEQRVIAHRRQPDDDVVAEPQRPAGHRHRRPRRDACRSTSSTARRRIFARSSRSRSTAPAIGPAPIIVTMVPKRKQIRETLARLDLWVTRSTLLLDAMRMTFANGDTKMMAFDEVVPNAVARAGDVFDGALTRAARAHRREWPAREADR